MSSAPGGTTDQALALRASRGDVEAFKQLVQEHSGLVYRVALRIVGVEGAQDASQEVWVRVWRNIENFRGESAFSTWLYRITVNTCLSARRTSLRRGGRGDGGGGLPFFSAPPCGGWSGSMAATRCLFCPNRRAATPTLKRRPSARSGGWRYRPPSGTCGPS